MTKKEKLRIKLKNTLNLLDEEQIRSIFLHSFFVKGKNCMEASFIINNREEMIEEIITAIRTPTNKERKKSNEFKLKIYKGDE